MQLPTVGTRRRSSGRDEVASACPDFKEREAMLKHFIAV